MTVCCGPAVMVKSLWNATGSSFPLSEMRVISYSPETISAFVMGHVDISEVKSGCMGISVQYSSIPFGPERMTFAVALAHPVGSG